jgi:neutral ceramidase
MRPMMALALSVLAVAAWAQALQAGAAANKITPSKQVYLAGYASNRPNTGGVHDDIWVRALVLQAGQERIAIAVCDLIGLLRDDVQKIRQRVRSVPPIGSSWHVPMCIPHPTRLVSGDRSRPSRGATTTM